MCGECVGGPGPAWASRAVRAVACAVTPCLLRAGDRGPDTNAKAGTVQPPNHGIARDAFTILDMDAPVRSAMLGVSLVTSRHDAARVPGWNDEVVERRIVELLRHALD